MTGPEKVLINDWCKQMSSHSIGSLVFGADGALYASSGDGAGFASTPDYGQFGAPKNPCGDAPVPVGGSQTPPTAQGGALRAQDLLTPSDPASLDGSIIRVNPATGAARSDNPNAGSSDPNVRRIVAMGLRQPYRMTVRPGTNELWIGDVGWGSWEEIDRVADPKTLPVENFGWPCYEGQQAAGLRLAEPRHLQHVVRVGRGDRAVLHVRPLRGCRPWRRLPDRRLVGHRRRLLSRIRWQLPGEVPGRALLRRLHAALHLGHVEGCQRVARPDQDREVRLGNRRRVQPGRPRDRSGRRPLLRRPRRWDDPAHQLLPRQPPARRRARRQPHLRRDPVDGELRREPIRPTPTRTRSPTHGISTETASSATPRSRTRRAPTTPPARLSCPCASPIRSTL